MASPDRRSPAALKSDLFEKAHEFSFFQVMRLLRLLLRSGKTGASQEEQHLRLRPELSLSFPPADVARIEEVDSERPLYLVTVTLLGLYGASSPLPTFYTEDLLEEASEDLSVTRDFLDILNNRIYHLLHRCWLKYRLFLQVIEEEDQTILEKLFCLIGLGEEALRKDVPDVYSLLRYTGLFTQFPKSASGLRTLLHDAFGRIPVEVIPCVKRVVKLPLDQRCSLGISGCRLGQESYLGEEIEDRMGKFRLSIGPLSSEPYHRLLPGTPDHRRLIFLTRFYLLDAFEFDIELILAAGEARTTSLGGSRWSLLGLDTWLFSHETLGEGRAIFRPQYE
ncbi:MAG: type VI secretion system baseplate subunit TssG [Desulfobacterota bacterium]|nr:type VI secretion system baseplate subunit TssG [Thermodesulfobacteriota bacterium]